MKATIISIAGCLCLAMALSGCATGGTSQTARLQDDLDAAHQLIVTQASLRESVVAENARLKTQNSHLQTNAANQKALLHYLQINDYLVTNKQAVIQGIQTRWEPYKSELFSASGGGDVKLIGFEVEDAVLYQGYVVVSVLYAWTDVDGAGRLGRGSVWLNPDKDMEVSGCKMVGQVALSAEQTASLTGQTSQQPTPNNKQFEQTASQIQPSENSWIWEAIGTALIEKGVNVGADWLMKQISSGQ